LSGGDDYDLTTIRLRFVIRLRGLQETDILTNEEWRHDRVTATSQLLQFTGRQLRD